MAVAWIQAGARFGMVPRAALEDAELSLGARLLFAYLATFADGEGAAFPGISTLAAGLGVTERSVRRYSEELAARGVLTRIKPGGEERAGFVLHDPTPAAGLHRPQPWTDSPVQGADSTVRGGRTALSGGADSTVRITNQLTEASAGARARSTAHADAAPSLPSYVKRDDGGRDATEADLALASKLSTGYRRRYAERTRLDYAKPGLLHGPMVAVAQALAPRIAAGEDPAKLGAALLDGFFANQRARRAGYPVAFLAQNPAEYLSAHISTSHAWDPGEAPKAAQVSPEEAREAFADVVLGADRSSPLARLRAQLDRGAA
ncbi:MAG: helix-turn-helix domain-containing protein [Sandaracinaceae bacterium]